MLIICFCLFVSENKFSKFDGDRQQRQYTVALTAGVESAGDIMWRDGGERERAEH